MRKEYQEKLIRLHNLYFEFIKPVNKAKSFILISIFLFLGLEAIIYEYVLSEYKTWGWLILIIPAVYLTYALFIIVPSLDKTINLLALTSWYTFNLKFGKEHTKWLEDQKMKGGKTVLELLLNSRSKKEILNSKNEKKYRIEYFNDFKGYETSIEEWTDYMMIFPAKDSDEYKFPLNSFWADKKRIEKLRNNRRII